MDLAWEAPEADGESAQRFRANVFTQTHGLAIALRPINRRAPSLAELNLPESIGALAGAGGGMVLVVGPTGAGKSTTLAAMLEGVNRTRARHVITLEDPIEFVYQPRRCLIHQREVGTHVESFAAGLRAASPRTTIAPSLSCGRSQQRTSWRASLASRPEQLRLPTAPSNASFFSYRTLVPPVRRTAMFRPPRRPVGEA